MEQYVGQIMLFAGNFTIRECAPCDGKLMSLAQNQAVFSILGTQYGGDGVTTFALPDLRGRMPIGYGHGAGLSDYVVGERSGTETTTLIITNMPAHNHMIMANNQPSTTGVPGPEVVLSQGPLTSNGPEAEPDSIYSKNSANTNLAQNTVSTSGNNQPFSIMQPLLVMNYMICLYGIYPSRAD